MLLVYCKRDENFEKGNLDAVGDGDVLSDAERAMILRHRAGLTQDSAAGVIGCCKLTVLKRERGEGKVDESITALENYLGETQLGCAQ